VVDYCGNSKRIFDNHPSEVAPARTSLRIQVPAFRRVPIARNDRRRALFPRKTAGSAVEGTTRQRGDPHPRRAFQRPPPARRASPYSDPVRTRSGIGSRLCTIRPRPPNRRDRSASLNFLICAVRVGCDTYSTVAACVKLFSFATAMKEPNYIASVSAPRVLGICAFNRLAQMRGFVQLTPESYNPPKLPIDTMTSANHGGCVLVGTTPTLRWPAKSEAMSPALLPAKRKPVDG
jgi:hypothetical protein